MTLMRDLKSCFYLASDIDAELGSTEIFELKFEDIP